MTALRMATRAAAYAWACPNTIVGHVRQYERWGSLFVPAYLLSSLVELLRGRPR